jgi:hypothetical protein
MIVALMRANHAIGQYLEFLPREKWQSATVWRQMKSIFFYSIMMIILTGCEIRTDPGTLTKIGKIVRVSKQGLIYKTWEGDLIRGGLTDGSGSFGASTHFTIESDVLANECIFCMENNIEVILYLEAEFISAIWRSESAQPYFLKSIKRVSENRDK